MLEVLGIVVAIGIGLFGALFSIVQFFFHRKEIAETKREALEAREEAKREALEAREEARAEARKAEERAEKAERKAFLTTVIYNDTISLETRQVFVNEYVSLDGNGPTLVYWQERTSRKPSA
jgi:hydroxylamine reductase (hybrid-cluster protein)